MLTIGRSIPLAGELVSYIENIFVRENITFSVNILLSCSVAVNTVEGHSCVLSWHTEIVITIFQGVFDAHFLLQVNFILRVIVVALLGSSH